MNKLLLTLLTLCVTAFTAVEAHEENHHVVVHPPIATATEVLPEEFTVTERWFSWTSAFDVETKTQKLGVVRRRIFSLTTQYDFYDTNEVHKSTARMRFFTFGAVFDVKTVDDVKLGSVEERIFTFFPTFRIFSPHGHILAQAKMNFWGTKYTLRSPYDDHIIAEMTRPFFSFRDTWTMKVLDMPYFIEHEIHPHLFITIAAFQTDLDNWRRQAYAASNNGGLNNGWEYGSVAKNTKALKQDEVSKYYARVKSLKAVVDAAKDQVPQVEPSDEDREVAANIVEETLENNTPQEAEQTLAELLTGDALPKAQRSAMFLLLERQLKEMSKQ